RARRLVARRSFAEIDERHARAVLDLRIVIIRLLARQPIDDRPDWHRQHLVRRALAEALLAATALAIFRFDHWLVKKGREIVRVNVGAQNHRAAAAAIAAIRAALRHERFAAKARAAVAAVAGLGVNAD